MKCTGYFIALTKSWLYLMSVLFATANIKNDDLSYNASKKHTQWTHAMSDC